MNSDQAQKLASRANCIQCLFITYHSNRTMTNSETFENNNTASAR